MVSAAAGDTTMAQAAKRLGVSPQWLSNKLRGTRRWSVDDLDLIASTYAVDVRALLSPAWRPSDLPEVPNKVTYSTMSFRHFGRRGWAVPGGGRPMPVAA
jgi:transcriptional regulator with XRE-family HTH domain